MARFFQQVRGFEKHGIRPANNVKIVTYLQDTHLRLTPVAERIHRIGE